MTVQELMNKLLQVDPNMKVGTWVNERYGGSELKSVGVTVSGLDDKPGEEYLELHFINQQ